MQKSPLIVLLLFICSAGCEQEPRGPFEILQLMEKSELSYNISILNEKIQAPDRSETIVTNQLYREYKDSSFKLKKYYETEEIRELHKEANKYLFKEKNFDKARELYLKIIEKEPEYYLMMTNIGQTYKLQENYEKAVEWLQKSIDNNYIDCLAHWFIAEIYYLRREKEKALEEITIAKILNRNLTYINESFETYYTLMGYKPDNWYFTPQIKIEKIDDENINIAADEVWISYAYTKAFWLYDTQPENFLYRGCEELKEKECLKALRINIENNKDKDEYELDSQLEVLLKAYQNNYYDEYIIYEILLPDNPGLAFQLTKEQIGRIKDYIMNVRMQKE